MITKVESGDGFTIEFYVDRFHLDPIVVDGLNQLADAKYDWRTRAFIDHDGSFLTNQLGMSTTMINSIISSLINSNRMDAKNTIQSLLLDKCSTDDLKEIQRRIQQKLIERI